MGSSSPIFEVKIINVWVATTQKISKSVGKKKTPTLIKKKPHHETEHWHSEQEDHGSSKSSEDSFPESNIRVFH